MKTEYQNLSHLIIDWGTSNFRAFAINGKGQIVGQKNLALGLLQVTKGEFPQQLQEVLSGWLVGYEKLPIYMAGMVGSQQGWVNVDYVATPVTSNSLKQHAHCFTLPWGACATIIPGVRHKLSLDCLDVMRGEEVQVFGALTKLNPAEVMANQKIHAVLPGTHSKHVLIHQGMLTEFSSFMTGELFSVISQHTILGRDLPKQVNNVSAFIKGVYTGQTDKFTNALFSARTHRLFNTIASMHVFDYLSGLLIGYELKHLIDVDQVYLIGGESLCERYQIACRTLDVQATYLNGDDCFIAGMNNLIRDLNHEQ